MDQDISRVMEANRSFYAALEHRSFGEMEGCWSHADDIACTHPGWHRLDGWDEVSRSWQAIFANSRSWRVRCESPRALLREDLAVVVCLEYLEAVGAQGDPARMQATNVFRKENGEWKMVHHHASPMPDVETDEEEDSVN
ncbi:MAG: nuclear transport factor 2 family protein [Thermoanaerobaculia bacterium]